MNPYLTLLCVGRMTRNHEPREGWGDEGLHKLREYLQSTDYSYSWHYFYSVRYRWQRNLYPNPFPNPTITPGPWSYKKEREVIERVSVFFSQTLIPSHDETCFDMEEEGGRACCSD